MAFLTNSGTKGYRVSAKGTAFRNRTNRDLNRNSTETRTVRRILSATGQINRGGSSRANKATKSGVSAELRESGKLFNAAWQTAVRKKYLI